MDLEECANHLRNIRDSRCVDQKDLQVIADYLALVCDVLGGIIEAHETVVRRVQLMYEAWHGGRFG